MAAGDPLSIYGSRYGIDTEMGLLCLLMVLWVLRHWAATDAGSVASPPERESLALQIVREQSQLEGACLDLEMRIEEGLVGGRCSCMS